MSRIIDILLRILANPNARIKDVLTKEDIACIKRVVGSKSTKVK